MYQAFWFCISWHYIQAIFCGDEVSFKSTLYFIQSDVYNSDRASWLITAAGPDK